MKRAKYGNVKAVSDDGITFDSKRELKRYYVLRQREKDGLIKDLELQVEYAVLDGIYEAVPVLIIRLSLQSGYARRYNFLLNTFVILCTSC